MVFGPIELVDGCNQAADKKADGNCDNAVAHGSFEAAPLQPFPSTVKHDLTVHAGIDANTNSAMGIFEVAVPLDEILIDDWLIL